MTLSERGRLGAEANRREARERARRVAERIREGECLKRAAHEAGVCYWTAQTYRKRFAEVFS